MFATRSPHGGRRRGRPAVVWFIALSTAIGGMIGSASAAPAGPETNAAASAVHGAAGVQAEQVQQKPRKMRTRVKISSAVQGVDGQDVCGTYFCTKLRVKVTCKRTACRAKRKVAILNKDPFGDNVWRVVWRGRTDKNGRARTRWLNEESWYYTYCCSRYPNPIMVRVSAKKTQKFRFTKARWSGEVSYRTRDLD